MNRAAGILLLNPLAKALLAFGLVAFVADSSAHAACGDYVRLANAAKANSFQEHLAKENHLPCSGPDCSAEDSRPWSAPSSLERERIEWPCLVESGFNFYSEGLSFTWAADCEFVVGLNLDIFHPPRRP